VAKTVALIAEAVEKTAACEHSGAERNENIGHACRDNRKSHTEAYCSFRVAHLTVIVGQQLKTLISHEYDTDTRNRAHWSDRIIARDY
jgi:hypothetical protein